MPEVYLHIEWPDGNRDMVYSPSTVINNYFKAGEDLAVAAFETKVTEALIMASQRVYQRFGYECTSAMAELDRLKLILSRTDKSGNVKIITP
ncbi:MAG: MSMEG_0570 family nitrogen starvation response protein [Bacteroidota bacterium]